MPNNYTLNDFLEDCGFECEICHRSYETETELMWHEQQEHGVR